MMLSGKLLIKSVQGQVTNNEYDIEKNRWS